MFTKGMHNQKLFKKHWVAKIVPLTSIEYSKASLGKIPTHTEIEDKKLYSPEKARDEFFSSLLIRCSDFAQVNFTAEQTTLSAHFQHLEITQSRRSLSSKH